MVPGVDANGVNKMTIEWELREETAAAPDPIDITPPVYVPTINQATGIITFSLTNATSTLINDGIDIRGPQGLPGEVNTEVVTPLPDINDAKEGVIYIHDNGIATVYDAEKKQYYDLDNLAKFSAYLTETETREEFYTKSEINAFLGDIAKSQREILLTLDKGSIDIPNGE